MAAPMEQRGDRSSVPIFLPKPGAEAKNEDPNNTRIHSTGHGKTRSYLQRFKLADDDTCLCNEGQHTSDHIIFDCNLFETQRGPMIKKTVESGGSWPLQETN